MDPRDVNRINYNNYYVGQNLDFLIRSKMRSESLSTPLTNTPVYYDDQVSSKMALLGKRGYYDPGYIYGFDQQNKEKINNNSQSPKKYPPYDLKEREKYNNNINPNEKISQEEYEMEMRRQNEIQRNQINNEQYNNNLREKEYGIRNELNQYENRDYPNDIRQKNYPEQTVPNNNFRNDEQFQKDYNEYLNRELNQEQRELNNNRENNSRELNLPKTREQIQHDVYIENFKRQQLAKQMMMEDEMKYKKNIYK